MTGECYRRHVIVYFLPAVPMLSDYILQGRLKMEESPLLALHENWSLLISPPLGSELVLVTCLTNTAQKCHSGISKRSHTKLHGFLWFLVSGSPGLLCEMCNYLKTFYKICCHVVLANPDLWAISPGMADIELILSRSLQSSSWTRKFHQMTFGSFVRQKDCHA